MGVVGMDGFHSDQKYLRQRLLLQYSNFVSLPIRKSVIGNAVISVYALRKQREIKTAPVLTRLS